MRKLMIGFDQKTEALYHKSGDALDIPQIRITLLVFSFLYAVFSFSDYYLVQNYALQFFFIRFAIVIPVLVFTIFFSYHQIFKRIYQSLLLVNFIVAGAGISLMLIAVPNNVIYYGGMFMIYFSGYLLLQLNYSYSIIGGWSTLLLYIVGFFICYGKFNDYLIYSTMFFIGANLIGMVGSYGIEISKRRNFLNNLIISEHNICLKNEVEDKKVEISKINLEIVFALATLAESKDKFTGKHLEIVGEYCSIITDTIDEIKFVETGYKKDEFLAIIKVASALHDVGKVGISDLILLKTGKLTNDEFRIMKNHTIIGFEILEKVQKSYPNNEFINMGIKITRNHHERFDGLGYPDGLKGEEIPLCARIMSLCDTYDALTSSRPYKEAYSHNKAREIIENERGKQFDPNIVDVFLENQHKFTDILNRKKEIYEKTPYPID